jgi:small-conductance mechanosensitive channel
MNLTSPLSGLLSRWRALPPELVEVIARALAVVVTVLLLLAAYRLVLGVIARIVAAEGGGGPRAQRARTLGSLLTNVSRWVLGFVVLVVVLRDFGVDVQALVVSAGVLGLAIGLGAQSLIRDVITGVFLLFEGLVAIGDVIQVGGATGTVEEIGLRVTKVRMEDGGLRVIPHGQLGDFANYSRGWGRALVEVPVGRDVSVDRALEVIRAVAERWARDTGAALEPPEARGIMRWSGGEVVLRLTVKVDPARRLEAEAELRRRIKAAFDQERWS